MASSARSSVERAPATALWALAALMASDPVFAEEPAAEEAAAEESKIEVHGFLTQGFGLTDGSQILGITEDGTSDYRTAAFQFRYRFTADDHFVAQLSHESLGASPLQQFRDEVELDWLFYEHRWARSAVRVGKVPIPFGIWNEVRDVGTVLPFYRPPRGFYGEGAFASETVDGFLLSRTFELGAGFSLDGDLYFGDRRSSELTELGANEVGIDDSTGFELWLSTPVAGLRLGLGGQRFEVRDSLLGQPGEEDLWQQLYASVEGLFGWFVVRSEVQWSDAPVADFRSIYLQVGIRLSSRVDLNLQAERSDLRLALPGGRLDVDLERDLALGAVFKLKPYLVLKAEVHRNEGFLIENPAPPIFGPPLETRYGILSLATSF